MKQHSIISTMALVCCILLSIILSLTMLRSINAADELKVFHKQRQTAPLFPVAWLPVIFRSPEPERITLQNTQDHLEARLGQNTIVTAVVTDNQGLIPNYPVNFSASLGQIITPTTQTDASGIATSTLAIDRIAIRTINSATYPLTITAKSGTITDTMSIIVTPIACNDIEDKNDGPSPDAGKVEINSSCIGSVQDDTPGDLAGDDYYRLELTSPGTIIVTLRGIPLGADYDLQLLKLDNNSPINIGSARPGNADEDLRLENAGNGAYYVRIYLYKKAPVPTQNTYILAVVVE